MSYYDDYEQGWEDSGHLRFHNRERGFKSYHYYRGGGTPRRGTGPSRVWMRGGSPGGGGPLGYRGFRGGPSSNKGYVPEPGFRGRRRDGLSDGPSGERMSSGDKVQKLDKETEDYFNKVYARFKLDFGDEEDKTVFLANVGEQTVNKELELARNRSASFCIQMLIRQTKDPNLVTRFMTVFADDLRMACTHFVVSHVTQTLLQAGLKYLQCPSSYDPLEPVTMETEGDPVASEEEKVEMKEEKKEAAEEEEDAEEAMEEEEPKEGKKAMDAISDPGKKMEFWILRVGRFCLSNLKEFMFDTLACHVTRTVVQVLAGVIVEEEVMRNRRIKMEERGEEKESDENKAEPCQLPEEFEEVLKGFVTAFTEDNDLSHVMKSSQASPILQTVLAVYHVKDKEVLLTLVEHIGEHVFKGTAGEGDFLPILSDTSASYVVEKLFQYAPPEYISKVWKEYLQGHLLKMSFHPVANFCAQRLLECVSTLDEFHDMYEELAPAFDSLVMRGSTTVLVCIAEACRRLSTYQAKFILKLQETLNCATPEERKNLLVPLTLHMMTFGDYERMGGHLNVGHQGALIIQHVLHFTKPTKVVNSLLSMSSKDLLALACCPKGSHVVDAFVMSPTVGEKHRDQYVEKMKAGILVPDENSNPCDDAMEAASTEQMKAVWEQLATGERVNSENASLDDFLMADDCALTREELSDSAFVDEVRREETGSIDTDSSEKEDKNGDPVTVQRAMSAIADLKRFVANHGLDEEFILSLDALERASLQSNLKLKQATISSYF